jgi:hypothetical protein
MARVLYSLAVFLSLYSTALAQSVTTFAIPTSGLGGSRPVIAEIDGNPSNGKELVVATTDGHVHVFSNSGALLWSAATPNATCNAAPLTDKLYTSPVVGDLHGNGTPYVVIGYGGFRGKSCDGGVVAYKGSTGERAWVFSIKSWAKRKKFFAFRNSVYATPSLADVDGDGKLEIGFGAFDRNIYLLNSNGSVRWYYNAADTVFSSPAFANVRGDSALEMLIGTDISRNPRLTPPTRDGGYLYALKAGITTAPGTAFGFRSPALQAWRTSFNQTIQTSPVVADIIPTSPGLEVATGSGCFFPQGAGDRRGKWYKIVSASTGRVLRTLKVSACTPTSPAVGDIDGDGRLEVVMNVSGSSATGGDGSSHLIAWRPSTNEVVWNIVPRVKTRTDTRGGELHRVPVLRDLNGDGADEVLINYHQGVVIVSGATGAQLTCDSSHCSKPLLRADSILQGSPTVADANGDGVLEIFAIGRLNGKNVVLRWENPL